MTTHPHRVMALALASLAAVASCYGAADYSIRALPLPTGLGPFYPNYMNSGGEVVGDFFTGAYTTSYIGTTDGMRPVTLPINTTAAWRILDDGSVVGNASSGAHNYLFVEAPDGGTRLIDVAPLGEDARVQDANNRGTIVGDYYVPTGPDAGEHAFACVDGNLVRLGSLNNPRSVDVSANFSIATAVNDAGLIAGVACAPDGSYPAFVYRDGQFASVGTPPGFRTALVRGMTGAGMLVGEASNVVPGAHGPSESALFLYFGGQFTLANSPAGRVVPVSINNAGAVVGIYNWTTAMATGFLYHDGRFTDLDDLVGPASGWTISGAVGINDAGQILGIGTYQGSERAFVMTPIPEPMASVAMVVFVLGGLQRIRSGNRAVLRRRGVCLCGVRGI